MKKIILLVSMLFIFTGCTTYGNLTTIGYYNYANEYQNQDEYREIADNPFVKASEEKLSSFSLDPSTAGYSNLRSTIMNSNYYYKNQVKLEEMINYFNYDYVEPTNEEPFNISSTVLNCPWNLEHKLISIGIKAKEIDSSDIPNNIVLLLDVSGSMSSNNKLPLLQEAMKLFVETLKDNDIISIVTYAGSDEVALEGAFGSQKKQIINVIEDLDSGGSTAGADGINTAYSLAQKYFIQGGNNRVILGTDGDFNVGPNSVTELENLITEKRSSGVYLSVLGFGYGNLKDNKLETLSQKGNGNYAYIDTIIEARKYLVEEINSTLNVISKDTKIQVEFNPHYIDSYRLLGYENQMLTKDEFDDENTDAGELGSGHCVTAVYEVVMNTNLEVASTLETSYVQITIRFKDPNSNESKEIITQVDVSNETDNVSEDILFITAVLEVGIILRLSEYKGDASYVNAKNRIKDLDSVLNDEYKLEFLSLIDILINKEMVCQE